MCTITIENKNLHLIINRLPVRGCVICNALINKAKVAKLFGGNLKLTEEDISYVIGHLSDSEIDKLYEQHYKSI